MKYIAWHNDFKNYITEYFYLGKVKNVLVGLIVLIINSCNYSTKKEMAVSVRDSIVELHNTGDFIIYNSEAYKRYQLPKGITYKSGYASDSSNNLFSKLRKSRKYNVDSLEKYNHTICKTDSVFHLIYEYYSFGCMEVIPKLKISGDTFYIGLYQVINIDVGYGEDDKIEISQSARSCENLMELQLKIDTFLIQNKILMFKEKECTGYY